MRAPSVSPVEVHSIATSPVPVKASQELQEAKRDLEAALERIHKLENASKRDQAEIEKMKAISVQDSQEQFNILTRLENVLIASEKEKERSSNLVLELRKDLTEKSDRLRLAEVENQELKSKVMSTLQDRASMKETLTEYRVELDRLRSQVSMAKQEVFMSTRETSRLQQEKKCMSQDLKRLDKIVYGRF